MNLAVLIPLAVAGITLLGFIGRGLYEIHQLISKFEKTVPTLERIAKAYPGKKLQKTLDDLEHAIDMQSQELLRLAKLIDRRKQAAREGPPEWRPEGWEKGDKL